jgi:hypothetical protein
MALAFTNSGLFYAALTMTGAKVWKVSAPFAGGRLLSTLLLESSTFLLIRKTNSGHCVCPVACGSILLLRGPRLFEQSRCPDSKTYIVLLISLCWQQVLLVFPLFGLSK